MSALFANRRVALEAIIAEIDNEAFLPSEDDIQTALKLKLQLLKNEPKKDDGKSIKAQSPSHSVASTPSAIPVASSAGGTPPTPFDFVNSDGIQHRLERIVGPPRTIGSGVEDKTSVEIKHAKLEQERRRKSHTDWINRAARSPRGERGSVSAYRDSIHSAASVFAAPSPQLPRGRSPATASVLQHVHTAIERKPRVYAKTAPKLDLTDVPITPHRDDVREVLESLRLSPSLVLRQREGVRNALNMRPESRATLTYLQFTRKKKPPNQRDANAKYADGKSRQLALGQLIAPPPKKKKVRKPVSEEEVTKLLDRMWASSHDDNGKPPPPQRLTRGGGGGYLGIAGGANRDSSPTLALETARGPPEKGASYHAGVPATPSSMRRLHRQGSSMHQYSQQGLSIRPLTVLGNPSVRLSGVGSLSSARSTRSMSMSPQTTRGGHGWD